MVRPGGEAQCLLTRVGESSSSPRVIAVAAASAYQPPRRTLDDVTVGASLGRDRSLAGLVLAAVVLPLVTVLLALGRSHLSLADDLLVYLLAMIAVTVVGGFWPAVAAAVAAALLLNWFFTPPLHTFTIDEPRNILALLLFVAAAVVVSSVVHLAAERARQADRLAAQAAQAEALAAGNRMRTALLAAVSHDLRTPLASVKASVSSLRQADIAWSPGDEAALLATIEESADRLDALIGNLLDMSRLQAGALATSLRDTALDEVVPLALHGLGRVDLDMPDDLPLVRTDPGLLERVLANLIANAQRFSPPGRAPTVRARTCDDAVLLTVSDEGPGVPPEAYGRIFEPFQRLGDGDAGGIGLGLAVAKGFCDALAIAITVGERPGGGLAMTLRIPPAIPAPAPVAA